MELAVFIIFSAIFDQSLSKSDFSECTRQNTYGYEYLHFYPADMIKATNSEESLNPSVMFYFEFYVKAVSDAHVLLADSEVLEEMSAYEIVIGGGKNSFSQIRLFPKETKTTQQTSKIMSPLEYKGFWVKLIPLGLITVGRRGETDPFLFWINPKPFPVRYIAFSTWTNVKGEWYFDCKKKMDSESGEEGNMTATHQLKNDLLTFYNPANIPQKDGETPQTVEVHLEASYFHMNEKRSELTLNGMAHLKWMDWKLMWNSSDYEGITYMHATPYQVWTPNVRVMNSLAFEKKSLLTLSGGVIVSNKGEVSWTVPFHSVTLCILGYRNWPFDMHNCSLVFGFWTEPLKIDIKDMVVSKILKSEWEIQRIDGKDLTISHVNEYGNIIDIRFCRRNPSFEFLLLPPFLGAVVLSFISFWFCYNSSIKLFLNCGSILVLVLILMSLGDQIPPMMSSTPKIVLLYSWSVLVECIPIVLFVTLKYVPAYVTLPRILTSALNSNLVEMLLCPPDAPEKQINYSHLREQEDRPISAVRLATIIERFIFFMYFTVLIVPFFSFLYDSEKFF